jgi:hypothetical protein
MCFVNLEERGPVDRINRPRSGQPVEVCLPSLLADIRDLVQADPPF